MVCAAEVSPNAKPKILHRREVDSSHSNPKDTIQQCMKFFRDFKPEGGKSMFCAVLYPAHSC